MKKLIELSDHPWIQERWNPILGDRYYHKEYKFEGVVTPENMGNVEFDKATCTEPPIWLPLSFDPGTGNWQVDDLLMEAGKFISMHELAKEFAIWAVEEYGIHPNKPEPIPNDLELKLDWLRELIDNQDREGA